MRDGEKVIKELESLRDICNAKSNMAVGNGKIAWAGYANAADDAISLLKEQEAKPIAYTDNPYTGLPVAKCPNCGKFARQFDMAHSGEETHFCPWCGQEVKWNDF